MCECASIIFEGFLLDPRSVRLGIHAISDAQDHCLLWLERYVDAVGEKIPNSETGLKRVVGVNKKQLHSEYCEYQRKYSFPYVGISTFCEMLANMFPEFE